MHEAMWRWAIDLGDAALDSLNAKSVCLLTWIAWDEHASEIRPIICEFQKRPWAFDPDRGQIDARQVTADLIDARWVVLARKAFAKAKLALRRSSPSPTKEVQPMAESFELDVVWEARFRWVRSHLAEQRPEVEAEERAARVVFDARNKELIADTLTADEWSERIHARLDEQLLAKLAEKKLSEKEVERRLRADRKKRKLDPSTLRDEPPSETPTAFLAFAAREATARARDEFKPPKRLTKPFATWLVYLFWLVIDDEADQATPHLSPLQALPWFDAPPRERKHYMAWMRSCSGRRVVQMALEHQGLTRLAIAAERAWSRLGVTDTASRTAIQPGPDMAWLRVGSKTHVFDRPSQRSVMQVLYPAWQDGGDGAGLTNSALVDAIGKTQSTLRVRVDRYFDGHEALGTVLRRNGKGLWALYLSEALGAQRAT
jgi:hypothetical protein